MSQVRVSGNVSGTGVLTVTSPNTNSNFTLTLPANNGTLVTNATAGTVLQVATTFLDGRLTTTNNGDPSDITKGAQVFSLSFTPQFASSLILVQTSSVAISESANTGDIPWLALFNGSTFISAVSGSWAYYQFVGNQNGAYNVMQELFSAGSTATRNISIRAGMNSGGSTTYINGNEMANYTDAPRARIRMTVMEIAA